MMGDVTPMIEFRYPVERMHAVQLDPAESGTTAMEKFINESTIGSASEYLYLHPDDESALSPNLPEPMLSNPASLGAGELEVPDGEVTWVSRTSACSGPWSRRIRPGFSCTWRAVSAG